MAYPSSLDNLPTNKTNSTAQLDDHRDQHNNSAAAINAIEAELGLLPKGVFASVRDRLDKLEKPDPAFNVRTAAYTLALADASQIVTYNAAGAGTFTVPANATVAFPIGSQITLRQIGAGQLTVAGAGGVTVNSRGGALKLVGQYSYATLIKVATDTWELAGDITV